MPPRHWTIEMLKTTEYNLLKLTIDMLAKVRRMPDNSDDFTLDLIHAKKALEKLLPYF